MSELKKRGAMFQKSPPDYVKDGLVLYLDGEEDFMLMDINGALTRIWRDRVMSSQKVHIGGVTQSQGVTYWDGVTSCARIPQDEYIALLNILSGLKERTIEVVCKLNDTDASQTLILGNGTSSETGFSAGLWYRPASGGFMASSSALQKPSLVDNADERASYSVVYGDTDINDYELFRNGFLCPKGTAGGNMNNPNYITVGSRYYNGSYSYRLNGEICCIRVYERKLSDEERLRNLEIDARRYGLNVS